MHSQHHHTSRRGEPQSLGGGFDEFNLAEPLCRAVEQAGYRTPTPIQQAAVPLVLEGHDLIGCAQTGTGKTAAFALPILHRLLRARAGRRDRHIRTLVLAPTRELAAQIADSFTTYSRGTGLRTVVVFGGVGKVPQVRALAKPPEILVATPGRLLDLLSDRALSLSQVEVAVLDEADRMLDMGFIHDVRRILGLLPVRRQTLLFSATMPREVEKLAAQFQTAPRRVAVAPVSSVRTPIDQSVRFVEKNAKIDALIETLRSDLQTLVFTRTKHGANKVVRRLAGAGISAAAIHGNKSQSARETALASFKSGSVRVVVATDLASRGLDIKELPLVVNFDLPNEPEVYVHRIGRTGRAGATGTALSFCSQDERPYLASIERLTRQRIETVGPAPSTNGTGDRSRATPEVPAEQSRHSRGAPTHARKERRTSPPAGANANRRRRSRRRRATVPRKPTTKGHGTTQALNGGS